jgi:hypothetical protein
MTELALYLILALTALVLAGWLVREKPDPDDADFASQKDFTACLFDANCLDLANRIFDPADYRWLRDELCFPQAAALLARDRRDLAIKWLKALRTSFKQFVGVPNPESDGDGSESKLSSWQSLWLTLRFQLLLVYALLVVRFFGPYHRLVPRLGWLEALRGLDSSRVRGIVGAGRIS